MSERHEFFRRNRSLFLGVVIGGFVGAAATNLVLQYRPGGTSFWARECRDLLASERADQQGGHAYFYRDEMCLTLVYPRLSDADSALDSEPELQDAAFARWVATTHLGTLRDSGTGGDVRVRFLVESGGAATDPAIVESSGNAALEAFALELVAQMRFSPGMRGDLPAPAWMEFPVAMRMLD